MMTKAKIKLAGEELVVTFDYDEPDSDATGRIPANFFLESIEGNLEEVVLTMLYDTICKKLERAEEIE